MACIIHISYILFTIRLLTSGYASGYTSESHDVVTEDGYILQIFRVSTPQCADQLSQPPVILMHSLLQNSDSWFDAGPRAGLGYLLSNECYDLWLGNQRGNSYSRRHQHLNVTDPEFWKFSVDEMGKYDIPAIIDYVLKHTGAAKVSYIGFGQGCATFYIMCSERHEYCGKVMFMISLAPATRHLNSKGVGFRYTSETFNRERHHFEAEGANEVFEIGSVVQTQTSICVNATLVSVYVMCEDGLGYVDASHKGSISGETMSRMFTHLPAGTSAQNLARYGQALSSQDFVKFDYGIEKNVELYGSASPPAYNLSAVTVPVVMLYGNNDGIVDQTDVEWAASKMPHVVELFKVDNPEWTHFDMFAGVDVPLMTYPKISAHLSQYRCVPYSIGLSPKMCMYEERVYMCM